MYLVIFINELFVYFIYSPILVSFIMIYDIIITIAIIIVIDIDIVIKTD